MTRPALLLVTVAVIALAFAAGMAAGLAISRLPDPTIVPVPGPQATSTSSAV
jgi:hypothetical protein